jgi:hypothetical protein
MSQDIDANGPEEVEGPFEYHFSDSLPGFEIPRHLRVPEPARTTGTPELTEERAGLAASPP